ncbi:hypothetical protein ACFLW8_03325 [Chloroflexota bacterium]
MTNGITWEEELSTRIKEAIINRDLAEESLKKAETDIKYWSSYAMSLGETLRLYREKQGVTTNGHHINAERMRKQSTWVNLLEITSTNNGILVVIDATTTLVEAGVFSDREHARNLIYSTLNSHKKDVEWMRQGVYQLHKRSDNIKRDTTVNKTTSTSKHRVVSGLRDTVRELKKRNPQMAKNEVLNYLIKSGFDFKGKKPENAVNMAWVWWGFHNENKQRQLLPNDII